MLVSVESFYLKKGQSDLDLLERSSSLCPGSCKAAFACLSRTALPRLAQV